MENKKELFQKYQEERTKDKAMFEVDRMAEGISIIKTSAMGG